MSVNICHDVIAEPQSVASRPRPFLPVNQYNLDFQFFAEEDRAPEGRRAPHFRNRQLDGGIFALYKRRGKKKSIFIMFCAD